MSIQKANEIGDSIREEVENHKARFSEKIQQDKDYEDDIVPQACAIAKSLITVEMKKFLDVGCGPGYFGKMIKDMQEAYVVGLEFTKKAAKYARGRLDKVHEVDVETFDLPYDKYYFDCIAYLDILEHLIDPWEVLKKHKPFLRNDGIVIASIPNIRNLDTLAEIINSDRWSYRKEGGILDVTHLRFFTWATINELFDHAGYRITSTKATFIPFYNQWVAQGKPEMIDLGAMTIRLNQDIAADFFVGQFVIKAEKALED